MLAKINAWGMGEVCEILFVNQNMFSVAASEETQGLEPKKSLKQSREIEESMASSIGGKSLAVL